jgi:hypothetical protein
VLVLDGLEELLLGGHIRGPQPDRKPDGLGRVVRAKVLGRPVTDRQRCLGVRPWAVLGGDGTRRWQREPGGDPDRQAAYGQPQPP